MHSFPPKTHPPSTARPRIGQVAVGALLAMSWLGITTAVAEEPGLSLYTKQIKPLLEQKCYACHGALRQQGSLRLDTVALMRKGGDSGSAIDANAPENSYLLEVMSGAAGFRMPPANEGAPLTEEELATVRRWLSMGAPAPKDEQPQTNPKAWWSYQPMGRPDFPALEDPTWCLSPVDVFIAARRESAGLPPARPATKSQWLRRVTLDLTGLPPTRSELQQFLEDASPLAFERVVDDLLERPEYGERWGRHWMDVWRYSDWYGSRGGNEIRYSQRHIWRWRDWIIQSMNQDVGYDVMVRQMLAADELAQEDIRQLPATGYLGRNWYKFDRDVWLFDTVERTSEALLGVRMRCCRCHDHKFEPITQQEYYEFRAYFEPHDVRVDPIRAAGETENDAKLGAVLTDGIPLVYDRQPDAPTYRFERGDSRYPDKSMALSPGVPASLAAVCPPPLPKSQTLSPLVWYPALRPQLRQSLVTRARAAVNTAEADLAASQAAVALAEADLQSLTSNPTDDPQTFLHDEFSDDVENADQWKAVRGDWARMDGNLTQKTVGSFATYVTKAAHPVDFRARLRYRTLQPGTYRSVGISFDYQDQGNSQDVYTSTGDARQSVQAFHRVDGRQVYPQAGIVPTKLRVGDETLLDVRVQGRQLTIRLNGERQLEYTLPVERRNGKFAIWVHQGAAEFMDLSIESLPVSRESLEDALQQKLRTRDIAAAKHELARAESESLEARLTADDLRYLGDVDKQTALAAMRTAALAEQHATLLRAKWLLLKGGLDAKERAAHQQVVDGIDSKRPLEGVPKYSPVGKQHPNTSTGRRAALANWIVSADNPRTARVAVNHLWGRHFGTPLVATTENFGLNGQQPTHPLLLDWLASELVRARWRMKPLHRQIVLSATYRMSSEAPATTNSAASRDNRYYCRMNSRRMEAEVVRDSVLALAKRLDRTMGGPEISEQQGEQTTRRSVYFRLTPNEKMKMLEVFDVADPNGCYRRKENVVPHQSLAMMNSQTVQSAARLLARQLSAPEDSQFIESAFETVLCRLPTAEERTACESFLMSHAKLLTNQSESASRFSPGPKPTPPPSSDPSVRARENLVHVLLMHNDFVTIR